MDKPNCSTEHRKNQHLTAEERHEIEVRLKDGWSVYRIARHLQRPYNTIKNEIQRGTVVLYNSGTKLKRANVFTKNIVLAAADPICVCAPLRLSVM